MSELDDENDYTLVFDHFYTNNHIQILKSLLPFFDAKASSYLPVLIKYLEFQHTLELTKKGIHPIEPDIKASSKQAPNLDNIYQTIKKYLAPHEEKSIQQIINMMHTMENVKEMQQMMEMFQCMNSEDGNSSTPFPDFSHLENMIGGNANIEDLMQMFHAMNK